MRAPSQPPLTEEKTETGQKGFGAWEKRNSWEMTQSRQLLLERHHFSALQRKEAALSTKAPGIVSRSAWLGEHRGSPADFPLVAWWVNSLLGIP